MTPMMAQFLEIKAEYPSALLFYRMGDFYELFFDDAIAAAEALDIALTKRGKHDGDDIPMCGVPVHSAEGYLLSLIRKGFRVAVCEQLEDPKEAKKRGSKSVVKRGVVRLVTPGTLTEDSLLNPKKSNYLAAYGVIRDQGCLAWVDISTGDVRYMACPPVRLGPELARLMPSELLISDTLSKTVAGIADEANITTTEVFQDLFNSATAPDRLKEAYCDFDTTPLDRTAVSALGALIEYLSQTQKGQMPLLRHPVPEQANAFVSIDPATRRSLELVETLAGDRKGSLLDAVDQTVTATGSRLLTQRVMAPSQRIDTITARLAAVDYMFQNHSTRDAVRTTLKSIPDMERALARLALGRGGPRDLVAIKTAAEQAAIARDLIMGQDCPDLIQTLCADLQGFDALTAGLHQALSDTPPLIA
ncbi:MAG: DNA mismatch repair protein MutS, partial [Pseudomonadota bacterium]